MTALLARIAPILAHQYGWDEIVMFLVPIVLAVAGVRYAEKRATAKRRAAEATKVDPAPAEPDTTDR